MELVPYFKEHPEEKKQAAEALRKAAAGWDSPAKFLQGDWYHGTRNEPVKMCSSSNIKFALFGDASGGIGEHPHRVICQQVVQGSDAGEICELNNTSTMEQMKARFTEAAELLEAA